MSLTRVFITTVSWLNLSYISVAVIELKSSGTLDEYKEVDIMAVLMFLLYKANEWVIMKEILETNEIKNYKSTFHVLESRAMWSCVVFLTRWE